MHRFARPVMIAGAVIGAACVDMSAPKGPASISLLQLPSPSVVVGDVMRDSTGAPAPLSVIAYDAKSTPLTNVTPVFFITDSVNAAHLTATNQLQGDKIGVVHVLGQIGSLQTPVATVLVTFAPAVLQLAAPVDTLQPPIGADSASSVGSASIAVTLLSANDSASQGFIVRYALTSAPATISSSKSPAVYLADKLGNISGIDTTGATGSSRQLIVNTKFLADQALQAGTKVDSAVVVVTTSYKGALVPGAPLRIVVPIRPKLPF